MLLEPAADYNRDVLPFIRGGILVDTSALKILINGVVQIRLSGKKLKEQTEFEALLFFLQRYKLVGQWNKFYITPHILAETCGHINRDYNHRKDYCKIIEEILPVLNSVNEKAIEKKRILDSVDLKKPIIEIGDLSIFLAIEDFTHDGKTAILVKDSGFNDRYRNDPRVLIIDFMNLYYNSP